MSTALPLATSSGVSTLEQSRAYCKHISKTRALNFYYGMRLIPEPQRSATYALYAWMREADDITDGSDNASVKTARLNFFWETTGQAADATAPIPSGSLWPAFRDLVTTCRLPLEHFRDVIDGQLLDLEKTCYETFDELYEYCYDVASAVGLLCVGIWGHEEDERVALLAEQRGIAFQLINILRDVREDAQRGRVYLPQEFAGTRIEPQNVLNGASPALDEMIAKTIAEARRFYELSKPLDELINSDCRACLVAMTEIYHGLLEKIESSPRVILERRVSVSTARKLWILLRAVVR